ncbi:MULTISPECIES: TraR/DksA C4-type zinc finger protein [Stutzerimonas stutzeri subgroup]|uniref:TraR/DksA C4-type zinc finger protein n=1 Tax=Stutzerimonas stutzeri subgroup TaxID=578833 RepID=UPI0035E3E99A
MDERAFELAQQREMEDREAAIARRVRYQGVSLTECEECGDEIPPARREAVKGCRLCIACQADEDKRYAGVRRG